MKRVLLFGLLTLYAAISSGQKSLDRLFDKYAGIDGFVSVTVSGNLLKLFDCNDNDDFKLPASVTQIRILAQEGDNTSPEDFGKMIMSDMDLGMYDELMRIKESHQDLRMLVRSEGNKIKEFLLIAGGEDNAIIQVKGEMSFKEARKFSEDIKTDRSIIITANHK